MVFIKHFINSKVLQLQRNSYESPKILSLFEFPVIYSIMIVLVTKAQNSGNALDSFLSLPFISGQYKNKSYLLCIQIISHRCPPSLYALALWLRLGSYSHPDNFKGF